VTHAEKIEKLKKFSTKETDFRLFLIDLLKRVGFNNVRHTHRYGEPEFGKDIIGSTEHTLDGNEWYSFVVKVGRILGGTTEIETIKDQIKQSFEYPYEDINGGPLKINKVKVVTNETISGGAIRAISTSSTLNTYSNYEFWANERLIELIDKYYEDFWLPGDFLTKEYARALSSVIRTEFEIKELSLTKLSDLKIQKLMDLFITPQLIEFAPVNDAKLHKTVKPERIFIDDIIKSDECFIVEGDPGSGKSRLLNKITLELLDARLMADENIYPIKMKLQQLKANSFDILATINECLKTFIPDYAKNVKLEEKKIVVLIDSIDDLYIEELNKLIDNICNFVSTSNYRFVISARSLDNINFKNSKKKVRELHLQNFNPKQMESFVLKYFEDADRGKKFLDVLRESNIFEKLPTTPLTITLISLLYEDTDYEIPATLTDIYQDFINVLLGKLEVRSKIQLIDLELKKRIFAFISYDMLTRKEFEIPQRELLDRINAFLRPKGVEFKSEEDLIRVITKSGLLYLDKEGKIGFKHLSFLEYFASIEIFYVTHNYDKLISNFNDVNWQNTAIFFAGISKDMSWFIEKLIKDMPNQEIRDWFINIGGMGYLSQALYLTDIPERVKLIDKSLENMILSFSKLKEMTSEFGAWYNMPLHIITAMLSYWFNMNFRSITLLEPLKQAYEKLINENKESLKSGNFEIGFKLYLIASTLGSKYLNSYEKFDDLINRDCFIKDPLLIVLGAMYVDIEQKDNPLISEDNRKKIKKEIDRYRKLLVSITKEPAYRFLDDYSKKPKPE
jgi:hypothetical protein